MIVRDDSYELLPCPFCGSDANLEVNSSGSYFVRCSAGEKCACRTRLFHENPAGAVITWNTRAGDRA